MAQQFVLKGVDEIRDYKSSDGTFTFRIKNDPRGGSTWQIPQWYNRKGNNLIYQSCTVLDLLDTNYVMIIPTSKDTQLQVTYDGDVYSMIFSNFSAVDRIAITDKSTKKLVVEYLMPSISGGAIAKRTLQPPATIGEFTITGKGSVDVGNTSQYQSNATPAQSLTPVYAWTVLQGGSVVPTGQAEVTAGATSSGCTVSWKTAGTYDVRCQITATGASDSPQVDDKSVVASVVETVGTVTVTGSATAEAETPETYTASVSGNNVNDLTYKWDVIDGDAIIGTDDQASADISFAKAGNFTVQCKLGSESISDTDFGTKAVSVTTAKTVGNVTINGSDTPTAATASNYSASIDGNVSDATYAWTVTPTTGVVIQSASAQATNITFNSGGSYSVKCSASSVAAGETVPATPLSVAVSTLPDMPSVSLGGPQAISAFGSQNYTSAPTDGSTLSGSTSYQWTAQDDDTSETTGIGVVITSPTSQNTAVTFSADAEGRTIALRCKYTNAAYTDSPKTGKRNVAVDTTGG